MTKENSISVIIPTFNEAGNISRLLSHLRNVQKQYLLETIVVDGGSTDDTVDVAWESGADKVVASKKGRASQMNAGAAEAGGSILYFLHADTLPPQNYDEIIVQSVTLGYAWGSFHVEFDLQHWFLRWITWVTRLPFTVLRFGDQSLFVTGELFRASGGFQTSYVIFEDTEFARRLSRSSKGVVVPVPVLSSARKFRENGVGRMCLIFTWLWILYMLGMSHGRLLRVYRRMIIQEKI